MIQYLILLQLNQVIKPATVTMLFHKLLGVMDWECLLHATIFSTDLRAAAGPMEEEWCVPWLSFSISQPLLGKTIPKIL